MNRGEPSSRVVEIFAFPGFHLIMTPMRCSILNTSQQFFILFYYHVAFNTDDIFAVEVSTDAYAIFLYSY